MAKVHILDSTIANRIAAGEVVERPSGIVKELVENAIDAGATRIEIRIKQGGIEEIQVIDNGCGMSKEDASLAFERHATSKIQKESDLWNIHTLGFRGEALPSVASVSDVNLITCDGIEATHIHINNGKLLEAGSGTFREGTQIIVRELFYALPARLKHLKTIPYETGMVSDIVSKLALANAHIAFILVSDEKEVFRSSGNGDYITLLYAIYGKEVAKAAIPITVSDDDFKITGYICLPTATRSNRKAMMTFMNTRLVVNYYLQSAILNGYHEYLSEKRFPMTFLNIEMSANLVDVNVHPSKWEVRLSKEKQLYALLEEGVTFTLAKHMHKQGSLISEPILDEVKADEKEPIQVAISLPPKMEQVSLFETDLKITKESYLKSPNIEKSLNVEKLFDFVEKTPSYPLKEIGSVDKGVNIVENMKENVEKCIENTTAPVSKMPFTIIGQLHASYILASNEEGLVIIDQHAANERIRFEEVREQLKKATILTQTLLVPYVLRVSHAMILQMDRIAQEMKQLGFMVEAFGEREIIVRETPLWLNVENEERFIMDLMERLLEEKKTDVSVLSKHALATLACHSSVRFNRVLSRQEMESTVERLMQCENPYHCPHGRPTYIVYEIKKLIKLFERG